MGRMAMGPRMLRLCRAHLARSLTGRPAVFPYPSEGKLGNARPAGGDLWGTGGREGITLQPQATGEFIENGTNGPDEPGDRPRSSLARGPPFRPSIPHV